MFPRVLVGVGPSLRFEGTLGYLAALRDVGAREALLVHALGIPNLDEMRDSLAPPVARELADEREAVLRLGFAASIEIATGTPGVELARIAEERRGSLILLGGESSRARELLLGSTAVEVLHRCDVPVLICGSHRVLSLPGGAAPERAELLWRLLYATDLTGTADRALEVLVDLVRAGARNVTLVRADGPPADRARLEHLGRRLVLAGADEVRVETPEGAPEHEIVRIALESGATMIVMGTSGRGTTSTLYLGSVSHAVARASPAPVLLVPPDRS